MILAVGLAVFLGFVGIMIFWDIREPKDGRVIVWDKYNDRVYDIDPDI